MKKISHVTKSLHGKKTHVINFPVADLSKEFSSTVVKKFKKPSRRRNRAIAFKGTEALSRIKKVQVDRQESIVWEQRESIVKGGRSPGGDKSRLP